jgi:hypothetical protein
MVFMLLALAPGGIGAGLQVQGGQMSDTSKVAQMQAYLEDRYGLTDPVIVQYARWIGRISPVKFGQRDLRAPEHARLVRRQPALEHRRGGGLLRAVARQALGGGEPDVEHLVDDRDLERGHHHRVVGRRRGLDRGEPQQLSEAMEALSRIAHRVIWVNPHRGDAVVYVPASLGMIVADPYIDEVHSGHNLASLERLANRLAKVG